jgi:hypothetical protein
MYYYAYPIMVDVWAVHVGITEDVINTYKNVIGKLVEDCRWGRTELTP